MCRKQSNRILSLLAIGVLALTPVSVLSAEPPQTADELRERFRAAWDSGDREAFLELFRWDGAHEAARASAAAVFDQHGSEALEGVDLEPAEPGINDGVIANAVRYRPNVEVEGSLKIRLSGSTVPSIAFPWGRAEGSVWIASVIQEPLEWTGPPDRQLSIEIHGLMSPTKLEFEATCDFVASGQKATEKFRSSGPVTRVVLGQRIDSCLIEKLGGEGWVELRIRVDGELEFESGQTDLATPLRYRGG